VNRIFPYLVLLISFGLASTAAYYSIFGLSKLFSASAFAVIIMASILEISKLVTATYLHKYWHMITRIMKVYLTIAVCILMFITSLGIYGFLVSSYQTTAYKMENIDKLIETIQLKKSRFETQLNDIRLEKDQITQTIKELNSKQGIQNEYTDNNGNVTKYTDLKSSELVNIEIKRNADIRNQLYIKESILSDSITSLDLRVLDLQTNTEAATELGPLRYISKITGKPMDIVVNWFILLFIIVFDPLAVILLIAANRIIIQEKSIKTSTTPTEYNEIVQSESDSVDIVSDNQITDTEMQPVVESKHLSQAWRTQSSKNKL
jgi:hypothetical protein